MSASGMPTTSILVRLTNIVSLIVLQTFSLAELQLMEVYPENFADMWWLVVNLVLYFGGAVVVCFADRFPDSIEQLLIQYHHLIAVRLVSHHQGDASCL